MSTTNALQGAKRGASLALPVLPALAILTLMLHGMPLPQKAGTAIQQSDGYSTHSFGEPNQPAVRAHESSIPCDAERNQPFHVWTAMLFAELLM